MKKLEFTTKLNEFYKTHKKLEAVKLIKYALKIGLKEAKDLANEHWISIINAKDFTDPINVTAGDNVYRNLTAGQKQQLKNYKLLNL